MMQFHKLFLMAWLLLGFSALTLAQNTDVNNGRIPELKQSHTTFIHTPTNSDVPGDMAFGFDGANTLSLPLPAGTPITNIGTWAAPVFASSGVRGGDLNYYFVDAGPPPQLYQFDENTGSVTLIGAITGLEAGASVNGIAYDDANSTYYLCGGVFTSTNNLYSFDMGSMTATLVAGFPSPTGAMIDIAINSAGVGYGYDLIDDNAYTFDPATGATTLLGPLGYDANYGQGMDIDQATGTIYLSAFNNTTFSGQLRTMDPTTGATTLIVDWGFLQIAPFAINNEYGPILGPGPATDPDPVSGATDVDINQDLSWTNPAGATSIEVFWGTSPGSLTSVYSGSPISTFDPGTMSYSADYYWKVNETDGTGTTTGSTWHFTTMQDPSIVTLFMDDFEAGTGNYTITTANGCPWAVIPISSRSYTLPPTAQGNAFASDADLCGSSGGGSSSTAVLNTPIDATNYQSVAVEWDNDWQAINSADFAYLDVSVDGGTTWTNVVTFDETDVRNTHEYYDISSMVGTQSFILRLVTIQPAWDWWWAIDNLQVTGWDFVPVELSSFAANTSNGNVALNWTTASETNNKGFEVQRSNGGEYQTLGFVQGNGTSTQQHSYAYLDQNVVNGNYSYRLRQVDFDGSSEYSQVVEVSVNNPVEFSLAQNYPNPFNPSTKINYALKVDSKVSLKVFDILGQEVAALLNENIAAGAHNVTFDASKLNSGVYLYKIEANGVDGSSFTSVKKMILTK